MRSSTSGQIELFSRLAMSGTGTCTVRSNVLAAGGATIVVGAAGQETRHLLGRPHRRRQPDPLRRLPHSCVEPLQ